MRPAIGWAAVALLGLTACSNPGGAPAPSSVTVTPTLHWATPAATASRRPSTPASPRPTGRTPLPRNRTVTLSPEGVGTLDLGTASRADAKALLDELLGESSSLTRCAGTATATSWGSLTVTFSGVPAVARSWEVDVEGGTSGLRLPRGHEWSPDRDALLERPDATVTTSGADTVVILSEGFRYRFGTDDGRARTVGAGTPVCA